MIPARFVRDVETPMSLSAFAAWLGVDYRLVREWLHQQGVVLVPGERLDATKWAGKLCPESVDTQQALSVIEHPQLGLEVAQRRLISAREASFALGVSEDHVRRTAPRAQLGTRVLVPLNYVAHQAGPEGRQKLAQILYPNPIAA